MIYFSILLISFIFMKCIDSGNNDEELMNIIQKSFGDFVERQAEVRLNDMLSKWEMERM